MRPRLTPSLLTVLALALGWLAGISQTAGAQTITYSGRAFGAHVVLVNPQPNQLTFSDTGPLPSSGGSLSASLVSIFVGGTLSSQTVTASTSGADGVASSSARVEGLVAFPGQSAELTADVVEAHTRVTCGEISGSSDIVNLRFGGVAVTVTGEPNQTITLENVATLVINEQIVVAGAQDITVNALHLRLGTGEEVIVSSAHSDVNCVTPTRPTTWTRIKRLFR